MARLPAWMREARRRRVFRAGALYIVGAWVVLQVADLALESFGYAQTATRYLWFAAIALFPIALVFGWRYDVTPDGIRRTPAATTVDPAALRLQPVDYWILLALTGVLLTVGWHAVDLARRDGEPVAAAPVIDPDALAVLPLANLTGDPGQDYLAAGIHDALITSLSKIRNLRVTSRTSALRVGTQLTMTQIASQLGVARVLEGSMSREGDRVRITVQLIDAVDDTHLWADVFDRDFEGVLSLQNQIARAIAQAVEIRLTPAEESALPVAVDVRPDTWDAYLRAMYLMHRETPRAYRRGIEIMRETVAADPGSPLAQSGLAYAYTKLGHSPLMLDQAAYEGARDAALAAIALDDTLAQAHLALGMYRLYYEWNWPDAERSFLRAIEINPSLAEAHYHYAWLMELFGDHDTALRHGEISRRLDPLSPFMTGWLAEQYRSAGQYERALVEAEATLELDPNYPVGRLVLGRVHSELGRHDLAVEAHRPFADDRFWSFAYAQSLAAAGQGDAAREILTRLPDGPEFAVVKVLVHSALHDDEAVFHWLRIARDTRAGWYAWLVGWFPSTAYLKSDARMQALARELDLP